MSWSTIFNTVYGGEEQNDQERRHHGKLGPSLQYHTKEQVSLVSQYPNYAKMYKHPDLDCIKITNDHLLHQACDPTGWRLVVVGLSGNCSRNKLERAVCDRDTSVVRDRDRFTLGREERVMQAMALSVNGVCGNGDRVSFGTWRCTCSRSKAILVSAKEAFICAVTLFFL